MSDALLPLRFVLLVFAGLVNREQAKVVDFLREENRVLHELLGDRVRLCDGQRRRLAVRGKPLGRRLLAKVATIVTPDTILRWHRRLVAEKHAHPPMQQCVGRPGLMKAIRQHIVRMAKENTRWGYCRIQGELKKLGHTVARSTIAKTLKDQGVPPSPGRPTSWRTFLKAHAGAIAAMDFFTAEVWTPRGLITHYVLFVIHHASRLVEIAGVTEHPDADFMAQVARNLTDRADGCLRDRRYVILDRDTKFTAQFRRVLGDAGAEVVTTAFQAPNMNAIAERFVLSIKRECLERLILFGADHLRRALQEFVAHYRIERPHQGLGNRVLTASASESPKDGEVVVDERLGGLLRSYRRSA
jgi:transposase InsO family protein